MGVREFYDEMYADSRIGGPRLPFIYRKLRRFETDRYELAYQYAPGGDSVLDIGCGDGTLLLMLKDKYREVWGVDIAEARINRIPKQAGNDTNIHVRVEDANRQLAFEDCIFDTITLAAVLEHIFDPFHLIKECHRLLRKGGTLIIEVPNVAWLPNRVSLLMGKLPVTSRQIGWDGGHLHYFTRSSLKKLLTDHGFKVKTITCGGIFARPRRIWGSLLGSNIFVVGIKE